MMTQLEIKIKCQRMKLKKNNKRFKTKYKAIKRMMTKFNIKIKYQWMK